MTWKSHLLLVVYWAEEKGFTVDLEGNDNCVCLISNIIELNDKIKDLERKTYIALHEAGHILVLHSHKDLNLVEPKRRNDNGLDLKDRMKVFLEETEAWERGYKLGIRLKIPINLDKWEDEKIDALQEYMKWVLKENE